MSRTIKILILNWPWTRKFSQLYRQVDLSHHDHALVTLYVQFLWSDWSKFDRWVYMERSLLRKLMFTDNWGWQNFVKSCDIFNCLFFSGCTKWNAAAVKILVIHGRFFLLVEKCAECQSHWKFDFELHRSQKWAYSHHLGWCVKWLKSLKRFWP